jgi:hypothetical protein
MLNDIYYKTRPLQIYRYLPEVKNKRETEIFAREKMTSQLRQTPLTCSGHTRPVVFLDFSDITPFGYFLISACKGIPAHFAIAYG